MSHVHGAAYHPQTQGKMERRHQTFKNRSCWKTIICWAILKRRLMHSSATTITTDIMKD